MTSLPHLIHLILLSAAAGVIGGCGSGGGAGGGGGAAPVPSSKWSGIRSQAAPVVIATAEFAAPRPQPVAVDGWEDGIFISRDGLHLYATYAPADLLSFVLAGGPGVVQSAAYLRGPTFGMDLLTNPVGAATWIHAYIVHASRPSVHQPFSTWRLSATARPSFSEGAVAALAGSGGWDLFAYTSNDHAPDYKAHIVLARQVPVDPAAGSPIFLPAPVTTATSQDNPHVERLDASHLVLLFESDDRPGGPGAKDLWLALSADDGASWSEPQPLASVDTAADEAQPHLHRAVDGSWWLYFSAMNPTDGKLGIFRSRQTTAGNWDSWGPREAVIRAGNTAGIGEPSLTAAGDLSFVVVSEDPSGPSTDRFDADPWFAPRIPVATGQVDSGSPTTRLAAR